MLDDMITAYIGNRILIFPTAKWVETSAHGQHKIYESKAPDGERGVNWLATLPAGAAVVSGNGPVEVPEQQGLFS